MKHLTIHQKVHYTLRLAAAMCFIGHGSFGIITKPIWCNYFAVLGIGHGAAYQLMPVVGSIDIFFGLMMLVYPMRIIAAWLVIWGIATALLRPLSGEPFAEFIERAGNFGAPLAMLLLSEFPATFKGWFARFRAPLPDQEVHPTRIVNTLKIAGFLLLAGHGWLNLLEKPALLNQYRSLGLSNASQMAQLVGITEIAMAFLVLFKPVRPLLFAILLWKMASELVYPQFTVLEWVERGGSYGVLLALWMVAQKDWILQTESRNNYIFQKTVSNGAK
jgi:hypothetical protein